MSFCASCDAAQPRELTTVTLSFPPVPTMVPGPPNGAQAWSGDVVAVMMPLTVLLPISVPLPVPLVVAVTVCPLTFSVTVPVYVAVNFVVFAVAEAAKAAARARPRISRGGPGGYLRTLIFIDCLNAAAPDPLPTWPSRGIVLRENPQ